MGNSKSIASAEVHTFGCGSSIGVDRVPTNPTRLALIERVKSSHVVRVEHEIEHLRVRVDASRRCALREGHKSVACDEKLIARERSGSKVKDAPALERPADEDLRGVARVLSAAVSMARARAKGYKRTFAAAAWIAGASIRPRMMGQYACTTMPCAAQYSTMGRCWHRGWSCMFERIIISIVFPWEGARRTSTWLTAGMGHPFARISSRCFTLLAGGRVASLSMTLAGRRLGDALVRHANGADLARGLRVEQRAVRLEAPLGAGKGVVDEE